MTPRGGGATPRLSGYVPELDGVRSIAIGLVLLHHVWTYTGGSVFGHALTIFADVGWCGVDIFFALSGFLITGILIDTRGRENYWKSFYIRRSLRIFPLYYATITALWLAYLVVVPRLGVETGEPAGPIWVYYLYLSNFAVTWRGEFGFLPLDVSWSLAIEEQFYLVWPFIVSFCSRRQLLRLMLAVIVLSPLVRLGLHALRPELYAPSYVFLFGRLDALALGGLVAWVARFGDESWIRRIIAAAGPLWLALIAFRLVDRFDRHDPLFIALGYTLVPAATAATVMGLVCGRWSRSVGRALASWPMVAVGKISYGLYLLHLVARALVEKGPLGRFLGLDERPESLLWALLHLLVVSGLAIALASASWFGFEKPILRLKSKLAPRSR
jgi:peptidoglycan/LPS O-acetylase OafA/YrhL